MLSLFLFLAAGHPPINVVAGSASDYMVVRHVVISGSNEQIGSQLASLAKEIHKAPLTSTPVAKERLAWFSKNYPEVIQRAKGVQSVYGPGKGDYTGLPYNMEFTPGCSVVYYPPSKVSTGHAMLSRNYDFPKASYGELTGRPVPKNVRGMSADPYVIEVHPTQGLAALYICAYDLLQGCVDGVNEKGVSVALLADDMTKDKKRGKPYVGLGEVDLPRYVLDKAKSAKKARTLLKNIPYYCTFTPCHYIISDATGDSFIYEVDAKNVAHITDANGKAQIITNHAIYEYGTTGLPQGNSFDRYRALQAAIAAVPGKLTPDQVRDTNLCARVPERVAVAATLWHSVYDLQDRSLKVSFCLSKADEKKERRSAYLEFRLGK